MMQLPVERISGVEIGAERAVAVGTIELQRSAGRERERELY